MDEGVVGSERAAESIEFGSVIAERYTILRHDKAGLPGTFVCRETGAEPLRSVWAWKPRHTLDPQGEAFIAEMARVAKLEHPQLQKLLDFGRDASGVFYSVYEPVELQNLATLLDREWPLSDERVVWLMCQLLATLEAAHAAGVVHGDIRPENILIRTSADAQIEEILLCGLGLAGIARSTFSGRPSRPQHAQLAEWIVGTPQYAAPEQLRGAPLDPRCDVYSAGVLLFQMLARTVPFAGSSDIDTAYLQCFTPPPPPSGYGPVTSALEAICLKALAKTPDLRYQSANELRAALLEAQASRNSLTTRQSKLLSRPPQAAAQRAVGSSLQRASSPELQRVSSPSIQAVALVARASDTPPARIVNAHGERWSSTPPPRTEEPRRLFRASPTMLLVCSTIAVAAALILPDLRLRDQEAEAGTVVRAAPASGPIESVQPAEPDPETLSSPDTTPPSAAVAQAPAAASAPVARVQPAKPAAAPAGTAPKPQTAEVSAVAEAAPAAAPAGVQMHTVEKTVIAAEASVAGNLERRRPVAIITRLDDPEDATAKAAAEPVLAENDVKPEAAPGAQANSEPTPPSAAPAAVEAQAAAAEAPVARELTRPAVVLANTSAPKAPAPSAPLAAPRDVRVAVGEATASHGAVSKNSLRSALNQSALSRCYMDAAQSGNPPARHVKAQLEFSTNMTGRVVSAKLSGAGLTSGFTRCVEDAARLGRVRGADTGEARATLELSFVAQ